jgi:3-oxoacyl-[acyl-carrier-protein] synthase-3
MRIDVDLALCGSNAWLPETTETTADAVAAGKIPADRAAELGVHSVPVALPDQLPPEMATRAAWVALEAAGCSPADIGLLLHCCIWHQGHDMWSAPHYIAARLGADDALPVTLSQGCNAVMPAIELAAARLVGDPTTGCALITAADRFLSPGFDRWQGSYGCAHGDGATAAVLRHGLVPGSLALRAVHSQAVPELEEMNRAGLEPTPAPRWRGENVDLRIPKKAYLDKYGIERFQKLGGAAIRTVVEQSLAEAGIAADDPRIRGIAVPRLSDKIIQTTYAPLVAAVTPAPLVPMHANTGHLSCGDVLANVADLHAGWLTRPGDFGVVLNAGGGYTWSALVVEVPQC